MWLILAITLLYSGECDVFRTDLRTQYDTISASKDVVLVQTGSSRRGGIYLLKALRPARCDSIEFVGLYPKAYGSKVVYAATYPPGAWFGNTFWRIIDVRSSLPDTLGFSPGDLLFAWPKDASGLAFDSSIGFVYSELIVGDSTLYLQYTRERWGIARVDSIGRVDLLYSSRSRMIDSTCADKRKSMEDGAWFGGIRARIETITHRKTVIGACFCDKLYIQLDSRGLLLNESLGCPRWR